MLLVKCKPSENMNSADDWRWNDVRMVVAIEYGRYAVDCSGDAISYPSFFSEDSLLTVYGSIPSTWLNGESNSGAIITSFPEWANDKYFYGYLFDNYDVAASKQAWNIYNNYVDSQLREFAVENFGSVEKAQEIVTKSEREKLIMDYRARGFEIPEEREEPTPLTFDNLYRAYERLNKNKLSVKDDVS